MINSWLGMGLAATALAAAFAGAHWWQRRFTPPPELARKLLHVATGLVALSFPWLFESAWPVIALATLATLGLLALRYLPALRQGIGAALHGVERDSLGEVYFAVSVALLFVLSRGDAVLYGVPLLVLTLADAAAALIGVRYGLLRYAATEAEKSAEGSVAFFTLAFLSVHVPLLLFTNVGRAESLLIALTLALLVMLLEAIAWRGLDNLFIPLGGFVLLKTYLPMGVDDLAPRLGAAVALIGFALYWRRRTTLNESAALAAALAGYVVWAAGGWEWLVAPLTVFLAYAWLARRDAPVPRTQGEPGFRVQPGLTSDESAARPPRGTPLAAQRHDARAVMSVVAPGLVWLFLARSLGRPEWEYLYVLAFAAHLALIVVAARAWPAPPWRQPGRLALRIAQGWAFVFAPWFALARFEVPALRLAAWGLAPVVVAALVFIGWQPGLDDCPTDGARWLRQGVTALIASSLGVLALMMAG